VAFFFLAAHAAFIRSDIFLRNAALFAGAALCFAAAGPFAGVALGAPATGTGAAAAAFAALTAAQRFFVAAIIALLPAALIFRFAGPLGPTVGGRRRVLFDRRLHRLSIGTRCEFEAGEGRIDWTSTCSTAQTICGPLGTARALRSAPSSLVAQVSP
jgi:hypothetical protein